MFVCYIPAFNSVLCVRAFPMRASCAQIQFSQKYKKNPTFARDAGFFFTNNRYFAPIANCTMRVAHVLFFALTVLLAPFVCFILPQYSRAYLVAALGSTSIHM